MGTRLSPASRGDTLCIGGSLSTTLSTWCSMMRPWLSSLYVEMPSKMPSASQGTLAGAGAGRQGQLGAGQVQGVQRAWRMPLNAQHLNAVLVVHVWDWILSVGMYGCCQLHAAQAHLGMPCTVQRILMTLSSGCQMRFTSTYSLLKKIRPWNRSDQKISW